MEQEGRVVRAAPVVLGGRVVQREPGAPLALVRLQPWPRGRWATVQDRAAPLVSRAAGLWAALFCAVGAQLAAVVQAGAAQVLQARAER